jgi:hypothetical protein
MLNEGLGICMHLFRIKPALIFFWRLNLIEGVYEFTNKESLREEENEHKADVMQGFIETTNLLETFKKSV